MNIIILRYFNHVGCHSSGLIGENPNGIPNNLMPYILKVAVKNNLDSSLDNVYEKLNVFGNDYNTVDSTAIRDFIYVIELAKAHLKSIEKLKSNHIGCKVFNVGTGKPTTVKQIIDSMININKIKLPYEYCTRRKGDLDIVYCNSELIYNELNWKTEKTLEDICRDSYNYCKNNY